MAKAKQAQDEKVVSTKERSVLDITKDVRAGVQVSMDELERIRLAGHRDLWVRHELMHGKKVTMEIPMDLGEKIVEKDGQVQYPMEFCAINGITVRVPKGVPVEVPYLVADLLRPYINSKRPKSHRPMNINHNARPTFQF